MTAGLYVWRDTPDQRPFWKACGIDTLQFCDTHWSLRADRLDEHYATMAREVDAARRDGFRVHVILFSNIAQWEGPAEREPTGMGVLFDPRDPAARQKRLAAIARAVRAMRQADGFTFLAGDPGGAIGAGFGARTLEDWLEMARGVREVVAREAPGAAFHLNPWAIAYWQRPDVSCFHADWWRSEAALTRSLLAASPAGCGIEVPGHDLYRPLALRTLRDAGAAPDPLPTAADVRHLRDRGVRPIWAWPYFLLDEADDGDAGPVGRAVQIETRYIHRCIGRLRRAGVDGIIGNWSYAGHLPRALNTYAFGRFCHDPKATPGAVLDEYARAVADKSSWRTLAQVLRFIENDSNWHRKLPPQDRLPDLPSRLTSLTDARAALARVRVLPIPPAPFPTRTTPQAGTPVLGKGEPIPLPPLAPPSRRGTSELGKRVPSGRGGIGKLPLPEPPEKYLDRLKQRLEPRP